MVFGSQTQASLLLKGKFGFGLGGTYAIWAGLIPGEMVELLCLNPGW